MMIRILIVDDHLVFAQALARLLQDEEDLDVLAIAKDEVEAEELLEKHSFDLALIDIRLSSGETEGLELAESIRKNYRNTKVIVLSMHKHGAYIHRMFNAGVSGYLLKHVEAFELLKAIQYVKNGQRYFPVKIRAAMEDYIVNKTMPLLKEIHLTPTEKYVLELIAEGMTSSRIAKKMGNKESTVEVHRRNIMAKFGVNKAAKLVNEAYRLGFLNVES